MNSSAAMSRLPRPAAISRSTSSSRPVSPNGVVGVARALPVISTRARRASRVICCSSGRARNWPASPAAPRQPEPVPGLDEMVARLAVAAQELSGEDVPARVAPPAWAAALHNPAPATTVRGILGPLRAGWVKAAQRMRDDRRLPPSADVDAAGAVLFALLPGFLL